MHSARKDPVGNSGNTAYGVENMSDKNHIADPVPKTQIYEPPVTDMD